MEKVIMKESKIKPEESLDNYGSKNNKADRRDLFRLVGRTSTHGDDIDDSNEPFAPNNDKLDLSRHSCYSYTSYGGEDEVSAAKDNDENNIRNRTDIVHDDDHIVGRLRNLCGQIVNCYFTQNFIPLLILANAIILGLLTFDFTDDVIYALQLTDTIMLIIFTIEVTARLIYLGIIRFFIEFWDVFDLFLIVFSWSFADSSLQVFRSFRAFRIFALISRWDALRTLFSAIARTVPRMATIWLVLLVFFYTFSVLFTSLYQDLYDDGYLDWDYFGRLDRSFITLFQFMTLDSWTGVVRQVMDAHPWAWLGFFAWVIITAFFVLNLVIAVICESLRELDEIEQKKRQRQMLKQQRMLFSNQKDEIVSQTQLLINLQKQALQNQLEMQNTLNGILKALNPETSTGGGKGGLRSAIRKNNTPFDDADDDSISEVSSSSKTQPNTFHDESDQNEEIQECSD